MLFDGLNLWRQTGRRAVYADKKIVFTDQPVAFDQIVVWTLSQGGQTHFGCAEKSHTTGRLTGLYFSFNTEAFTYKVSCFSICP